MRFHYLEERCKKDFGWETERLKGIKKTVANLKGSLCIETEESVLKLPKHEIVIVNSYSVHWTTEMIAKLLNRQLHPITMIEWKNCSFVSYPYNKWCELLLDKLEERCDGKPILFLGTNTVSIRDGIKLDTFLKRYGGKYPTMNYLGVENLKKSQFEGIGGVFAINDVVATGLMEFFNDEGIDLPIATLISTMFGRKISNKFICYEINNFELGAQAVKLASFVYKTHADQVGMYLALPNVNIESKGDAEKEESDYRDEESVAELSQINRYLEKCDDTDIKIIELLSNGLSVANIARSTFLGETTIKYRIEKIFQTTKLKTCRAKSKLILQYLAK